MIKSLNCLYLQYFTTIHLSITHHRRKVAGRVRPARSQRIPHVPVRHKARQEARRRPTTTTPNPTAAAVPAPDARHPLPRRRHRHRHRYRRQRRRDAQRRQPGHHHPPDPHRRARRRRPQARHERLVEPDDRVVVAVAAVRVRGNGAEGDADDDPGLAALVAEDRRRRGAARGRVEDLGFTDGRQVAIRGGGGRRRGEHPGVDGQGGADGGHVVVADEQGVLVYVETTSVPVWSNCRTSLLTSNQECYVRTLNTFLNRTFNLISEHKLATS